ncbi:peptidoglycan recognition protein [Streptomyces sp. NPDC004609]|uniref:peptidoglycan recognition protein family protein n=1 Tax=Streptomyces sp. NPDC004609 TaxID=3364704 RepID=UPI0036C01FE7
MRGFLASSTGVAASAALVLSLTSGAAAAPPRNIPPQAVQVPDVPGSTQSLPLPSLSSSPSTRSLGPTAQEHGLLERRVKPFSLVGVVWSDASAELHGTVQVRTRATGSGVWSAWQDVETHTAEHGADPDTREGSSGRLRGATAPLWVGASDGVEVRVRSEEGESAPLPGGMRLELVDPGEAPAAPSESVPAEGSAPSESEPAEPPVAPAEPPAAEGAAAEPPAAPAEESVSPAEGAVSPAGGSVAQGPPPVPTTRAVIPASVAAQEPAAVPAARTEAPAAAGADAAAAPEGVTAKKKYVGPRPAIVTRKKWGASESLREKGFVYTKTVKAAFVHHTSTGNAYTCKQAPSVLRSIYRYHVVSSGWRDFGYNFAVDKCGNIYEGRAGGVTRPVLGAHTLGFNSNSMGIAVLGTYSRSNPPTAAVNAVSRLTAWKLGLFNANPKSKVTLTSGGSDKYKKGRNVRFNVISGHRDGFRTDCPGTRLYNKLGTIRSASAKHQGRG